MIGELADHGRLSKVHSGRHPNTGFGDEIAGRSRGIIRVALLVVVCQLNDASGYIGPKMIRPFLIFRGTILIFRRLRRKTVKEIVEFFEDWTYRYRDVGSSVSI